LIVCSDESLCRYHAALLYGIVAQLALEGETGELYTGGGLREDQPGVGEQETSRAGEPDGARGANEQRDPDGFFELADLLAERRLGDVHSRSGASEMQLLGDGDEILELAQLDHHGWAPWVEKRRDGGNSDSPP
jgi:hypothetical protein